MSWTAPTTRATGYIVLAADWNGDIVNNLNAGPLAATVTALNALFTGGVPAGGARGRIRARSSPYDFLELVYDDVYGKWVSPPQLLLDGFENAASLVGAAWTTLQPSGLADFNGFGVGVFIPHKTFLDAGLTLQVRVNGIAKTASGHTIDLGCLLTPFAPTGAAGTPNASSALVSTSSTSDVHIDSDWVAPPTITTPAQNALVNIQARNSSSDTSNAHMVQASIWTRWVA